MALGPLTIPTCDRDADGSMYVREAAELADIQARIRRDLQAVGRLKDHTAEAIVIASNVVRRHPRAWAQWTGTPGHPEAQACQLVLEAWREARAEAQDPSRWAARLRLQAAEQVRYAEGSDALAAQRQRQAEQHTVWSSPEAADYADRAQRLRTHAQACRARAADLTREADELERRSSPATQAEAA